MSTKKTKKDSKQPIPERDVKVDMVELDDDWSDADEPQSNFKGNPLLKKVGTKHNFTTEQIAEYKKCMKDVKYFIQTYCKIISVDDGLVPFKLYPAQKRVVDTITKNRKVVVMQARQTGKTAVAAACILHYTLFEEAKSVAILANKKSAAFEVVERYQLMYENLPIWMQQGVVAWNKGSVILENNSKIYASATTASGIRGKSCNWLYIDEAAIIPSNVAEQFFASVYPVISSGKTTKILMTSTPLGYNHFWELWNEATKDDPKATPETYPDYRVPRKPGQNGFIPIFIPHTAIPGRDAEWEREQRALMNEVRYSQEVLCLAGYSHIHVRNKRTGEIEYITLRDFTERLSSGTAPSKIHFTDDYEILTPTGYRQFKGIVTRRAPGIKFIADNGSHITSSHNHRFIIDGREVVAYEVKTGALIGEDFVVSEIIECGEIDLYDPLNVEGSVYLSEGLEHHNCTFLGSTDTLIAGTKLATLSSINPSKVSYGLSVYNAPKPHNIYVLVADVAHGVGEDYSSFIVVNVTRAPYYIDAVYMDNKISPLLYPSVINKIAREYNNAYVLMEINDIGFQVVDALYNELEYDNIISTVSESGKARVSPGHSKTAVFGVRASRPLKRQGAFALKALIEEDRLPIFDKNIIYQLGRFVQKNHGFQAEEGYHDDLVTCLLYFAWLTTQQYFKSLTDTHTKTDMFSEAQQRIEEELSPFGFFHDGLNDSQIVADGAVWDVVS